MRKLSFISFGIPLLLMLSTLALQVHTDPDPWVATYDTANNPEDHFLVAETVRVKAYCGLGTPYNITVYTSTDGGATWSWVKNITSNIASYSGDHSDISASPVGRRYELRLLYASTRYATGTIFVIPEVPLGVATVLIACFAGLGYKRLRLRRKRS